MPRLDPAWRLVSFDSIDSTNDEAKRQAIADAQDRTIVWALSQTAGRGRRGRAWVSPPGNLYVSLVIRPMPGAMVAQLAFVAAIAFGEAVSAIAPQGTAVSYKWPNDLLLNGRKAAGILLESSAEGDAAPAWLIVGLGANLISAPADTEFPATTLAAEGCAEVSPERLLEGFCERFSDWRVRWESEGFAPVRAAWLVNAEGIGKAVEARLANGSVRGRFEGLDEGGSLILEQDDGSRRLIAAGEVFFAAA